ncbi:hypothetical protein FACS189472_09840 [Alphaproteobacteria bacterium]|nr:hypothetical protein FACS189472_09840 [Alphaproteobacteria bacterium]
MSSDQFKNFIGVDVSKDKIDIFSSLDGKHLEVKNDQKSITKAFKSLIIQAVRLF